MSPQQQQFPFERFRQARFGDRPSCVHCASSRVQRWGGFSGRRRYRCTSCTRTFSDFTATPLARLMHVDRWEAFCRCTIDTLSVRRTGQRLGIDKNTAFRWRHRLLSALDSDDTSPLTGSIAFHETWFAHSAKGSRRLNRPARARKTHKRHLITPVWAFIAQDETDRIVTGVVGRSRPGVRQLERSPGGRLRDPRELVCSHGPYGSVGTLAVRMGVPYRRALPIDPVIRGLRDYELALRRWLKRFRGVATRYLAHYLAWHRFEVLTSRRAPASALALLFAGRFP